MIAVLLLRHAEAERHAANAYFQPRRWGLHTVQGRISVPILLQQQMVGVAAKKRGAQTMVAKNLHH